LEHNAFDSENLSLALNLTDVASKSRLFSSLPPDVVSILSTEAVCVLSSWRGVL
jgi:hypothetical protein